MDRSRFAITVCFRSAGAAMLCAFFLVAMVLVSASRTLAEDDDLFQVLGIRVDETDQTAAAARTKALAAGERRAWEILVQRLVDPAQRAKMAALPQIGDTVKDFWVTEEKTSPVRYIATLNYNFDPAAVQRLLAGRGARFATTRSKPVLAVPVVLPSSDNQASGELIAGWRQAWRSAVRDRGLVPLRLPSADGGDSGSLAIDPTSSIDRDRLAELARRNDADEALVSIATVSGEAAGRVLKTVSTRYPASGSAQSLPDRTYPLAAPENDATVLAQAAMSVIQELQNSWRRSNAISLKPVGRTLVKVPTLTLADWIDMRRRLIDLPQAQGVQILSVGREYATLDIAFPGDTNDLAAALERQGLALRYENGSWLIMEASTLPSPGSTAGSPAADSEPGR